MAIAAVSDRLYLNVGGFLGMYNVLVEERMCEAEVKKSASLIVMPI